MRAIVMSATFAALAGTGLTQNGWVLSAEGILDGESDGAAYIRELLAEYADEGAATLYNPNSPEAKIDLCKSRLSYAERVLAQALFDYQYTLSISVKGAYPHNEGVECRLSSSRNADITIEGPTD